MRTSMGKDDADDKLHDPAVVLKRFAGKFHTLRVAAGLKQSEVAEQIDVRQATVSAWERGERLPDNPAHVFALEDVFKLKPGTLSTMLGYVPVKAREIDVSIEYAVRCAADLDEGDRIAVLALVNALRSQRRRITEAQRRKNAKDRRQQGR